MKKFIAAIAVIAICGAVTPTVAADRYEQTFTIAAAATSAVQIVDLTRPYGTPVSTIDSVFATATSGNGTGTVAVTQYEYWNDIAISTLTGVRVGTANIDRPMNRLSALYMYPVVQNVVTGNYAYAIQNLQTNYTAVLSPYLARQLRIRIGQGAVANETTYKVVVYVKEDPPPPQR